MSAKEFTLILKALIKVYGEKEALHLLRKIS